MSDFKYELIINAPRFKVIQFFDNDDNLEKWQPELLKKKLLKGKNRSKNSKYILAYNLNGKLFELFGKIEGRHFPEVFTESFRRKGIMNWVVHYFSITKDKKTKWLVDNMFSFKTPIDFVLYYILYHRKLRKIKIAHMNNFKAYLESK